MRCWTARSTTKSTINGFWLPASEIFPLFPRVSLLYHSILSRNASLSTPLKRMSTSARTLLLHFGVRMRCERCTHLLAFSASWLSWLCFLLLFHIISLIYQVTLRKIVLEFFYEQTREMVALRRDTIGYFCHWFLSFSLTLKKSEAGWQVKWNLSF